MLVKPPADSFRMLTSGGYPLANYQLSYSILTITDAPFGSKTTQVFVENREVTEATLDFEQGTFGPRSIYDYGQCELVDAHQWNGSRPLALHDKTNKPVIHEPALWDIASVDMRTGERIIFARSHSSRDDMFTILNRLNSVLDYARQICNPWRDQLLAGHSAPRSAVLAEIESNPLRIEFRPIKEIEHNAKDAKQIKRVVKQSKEHAPPVASGAFEGFPVRAALWCWGGIAMIFFLFWLF